MIDFVEWPIKAAQSLGLLAVGACVLRLLPSLMCFALKIVPGLSLVERKTRASHALPLTASVLSAIVVLVALFSLSQIWGLNPLGFSATPVGQKITATSLSVIIVLVVAAVSLEATGLAMHYSLGRLQQHVQGDYRRISQLNTLGPIIRSAIQITIVILAVMTLLSQVGVQIAPILAGAGVVGIAIGFGAQTLVKDFFTGFFLIVEDIVAVGDIVQIQAFSGEVEQMSLRTIRLRDFDGTLHIFPYGEAQIIHNMTKTFSYSAFDLPIRPDADLDKAMTVMRKTAEDLQADKEFGPLILSGIEIPGVDLLSDIGIVIKARIRTLPLERWRVAREYNRRIKRAFETAEIVFTHK